MEEQSGEVLVRYLAPEKYNRNKALISDLSLIWIPAFNSRKIDRAKLSENPIRALRDAGYKALPSLSFVVLPGAAYLESVSAESEKQTQVRHENYEVVWADAQPFATQKPVKE
jgi:hypothetical protein